MVKKLTFHRQQNTRRPTIEQEYLDLLRACPNLQQLIFKNVNPKVYLKQMQKSVL